MKQEIFDYNSVEYNIFIGQNKFENFELIDETMPTDIWFHVENIPSCHIILKTETPLKMVPRQVIKRCAYLCKINSKAKTLKKCNVIYTTIDHVKKTDIIGKVNVSNYKTMNV